MHTDPDTDHETSEPIDTGRRWTLPRACELFGVRRTTAEQWIKDGRIPMAGRFGNSRQLDLRSLFAIGLLAMWRRKNFPLAAFVPVTGMLKALTTDELMDLVGSGATVLVTGIGIPARLVPPVERIRNDLGYDVPAIIACDAGVMMNQLLARILADEIGEGAADA